MFKKIFNKLNNIKPYRKDTKLINDNIDSQESLNEDTSSTMILDNDTLKKSLQKNMELFDSLVGKNYGVKIRDIRISVGKGIDATLIFVDGLADKTSINDFVIRPLLTCLNEEDVPRDLLEFLSKEIIRNLEVKQVDKWVSALDAIFSGDTILLIDGYKKALLLGSRSWKDRTIEETNSEQVIFGPRDGFTETLLTNAMLIRRRIKSYKLKLDYMVLGRVSKTEIVICYIMGIANPEIVNEVKSRINRIDTDSIVEATELEELIEDAPFAVVSQIRNTERPDKVASSLLEGGVAILIDGTPTTLLMPSVFWQCLVSSGEYNQRLYMSTLIRVLRLISLVAALTLSGLYVAILSFHQEMIPISVLYIIVSGKINIPFPVLLEVLIMEFILEVIREAGERLPTNVGTAISIVGALVLGQASIQSKLTSPITVTIVALSAITNFTIASFSHATSMRYLRFIIIIISGFLGMFGMVVALLVLLVHLCSLRSFGVPYMAPIGPFMPSDIKDTIVRVPKWGMIKRPNINRPLDSIRESSNLKPGTGK